MLDNLRLLTSIGALVSLATVMLFGWHSWFFARRWRSSATARYMATLFFVMACSKCLDVIYSGMVATGAQANVLLARTYPLWLALAIATALVAHFAVKHFEGIIMDQAEKQNLLAGGPREWE